MTGPSKSDRTPGSRREAGMFFLGLAVGFGGYPGLALLLAPTGLPGAIMAAVTIALLVVAFVKLRPRQ